MTKLITLFFVLNFFVFLQTKPIELLILGKAGIGKSTLINNLMNENVAYVCDDETGTTDINMYETTKYGFDFKIYDTPGLYDGNNNDNKTLNMIINRGPMLNILIVCFDISDTRIRPDDIKMKQDIIDTFGQDILKYVIVIYTKSNLVNSNELLTRINNRHTKMNWSETPYGCAYDSEHENWRSTIWYKMLDIAKKNKLSFFDVLKAGTSIIQQKLKFKQDEKRRIKKEEEEKMLKIQRDYEEKIRKIQKENEERKYYEEQEQNRLAQIEYERKRRENEYYEEKIRSAQYNYQKTKEECFDINSNIYTIKNNQEYSEKLANINIGDTVKTDKGYSQVYFTYEHDKEEKLLNIKTFNDNIKITENHIIIVKQNDTEKYIKANEVKVGDQLKTLFGNNTYWSNVIQIDTTVGKTKYLLTFDDTIIVNDIVASCHVDNHNLGYYSTYILRIIYYYCSDCLRQDYNPIIEFLRFLYTMIIFYY